MARALTSLVKTRWKSSAVMRSTVADCVSTTTDHGCVSAQRSSVSSPSQWLLNAVPTYDDGTDGGVREEEV